MLDRLDQFPWSQVRHAYGDAADVPEVVRALLTDDPKQRDHAAWVIDNNLNHQSDVYPATLPLTPFLIEMLTVDNMPAKAEVLGLLLGFAVGATAGPYRYHGLGMTDDEIERAVIAQNELVKNVREAVKVGLPLYRQLLDDPEPKTRQEAARLLSKFEENAVEVIDWLRSRIEIESEPTVKAYILEQLGYLIMDLPLEPTHELWGPVTAFIQTLTTDDKSLVRIEALCLWIQLMKEDTTPADVSSLISNFAQRPTDIEPLQKWSIIFGACDALVELGPERGVNALLEIARLTPVEDVFTVLRTLLELIFSSPKTDSLSAVQKLVLSELVAQDEWWIERPNDNGKIRNAIPWMREYGLPDDREALRQVLSRNSE